MTDVLVNGTEGVWVDRGHGLESVALTFPDAAAVRALAARLAAACGQRLDDASPVVDGSLPDGTRLHAVLPPLSATGTLISLRTHRAHGLTLDDLVRLGTVPAPLAPVLRALVARRTNVLVSGATGSGKTTLLAALLSLAGGDERIVCIEESAEPAPGPPARGAPPGAPGERPAGRGGPAERAWSAPRCGCGRTGSCSGSAAAPRSGTCWPP